MSDKDCPDRRKPTPFQILSLALPLVVSVAIVLFMQLVVIPRASATEKLNDHETRITVIEKTIPARLDSVEGKIDKVIDILIDGGR